MKQISNWLDRAIKASKLDTDHRFKKWARIVQKIDATKKDGFAFVGPYFEPGTSELDISKPLVILVASETGSMKYRTTSYQVVILSVDGGFEITDISTTNKPAGWALRIRDKVAALLHDLESNEAVQVDAADELIAFLKALPTEHQEQASKHIAWLETL